MVALEIPGQSLVPDERWLTSRLAEATKTPFLCYSPGGGSGPVVYTKRLAP